MVANHFCTSSQEEWVVLALDASKLTAQVKYEPAAPVGNTAAHTAAEGEEAPLFPHLFSPIDAGAVVREWPMQRGSDGSFTGIAGLVP